MIRQVTKFVAIAVIVSMYFVPATQGVFIDMETATGNLFAASSLDIDLQTLGGAPFGATLFAVTDSEPGETHEVDIRVVNSGVVAPQYQPVLTVVGDATLCSALDVVVTRDATTVYSGSLASMSVAGAGFSGGADDWNFATEHNADSASLQNLECDFTVGFRAWQSGFTYPQGFTDVEVVTGSVDSGSWAAVAGSVVINEVMWMGSVEDFDEEWLELRNTTGSAIDLAGWTIDGAGSGSGSITITSGSIPANGFFLLSRRAATASLMADGVTVNEVIPGMSFVDGGEVLTLRDQYGAEIDATPSGAWVEGEDGAENKSMERNSVPGDGTDAGSWHTCIAAGCNDLTFWDSEGVNYGTPGDTNLSENDPTDPIHTAATTEEGIVEDTGDGNNGEDAGDTGGGDSDDGSGDETPIEEPTVPVEDTNPPEPDESDPCAAATPPEDAVCEPPVEETPPVVVDPEEEPEPATPPAEETEPEAPPEDEGAGEEDTGDEDDGAGDDASDEVPDPV